MRRAPPSSGPAHLCGGPGTGPNPVRRTASGRWVRTRPRERAVAAVERKVGIVEGYWTLHAARQGAMLTAHLVPREAEEVLGVLGTLSNFTPSAPRLVSARAKTRFGDPLRGFAIPDDFGSAPGRRRGRRRQSGIARGLRDFHGAARTGRRPAQPCSRTNRAAGPARPAAGFASARCRARFPPAPGTTPDPRPSGGL